MSTSQAWSFFATRETCPCTCVSLQKGILVVKPQAVTTSGKTQHFLSLKRIALAEPPYCYRALVTWNTHHTWTAFLRPNVNLHVDTELSRLEIVTKFELPFWVKCEPPYCYKALVTWYNHQTWTAFFLPNVNLHIATELSWLEIVTKLELPFLGQMWTSILLQSSRDLK